MKRTLEKLLPRGRLGRGVFMLAGGTAAGQGFVLLAAPLLTRLYTPKDFGVLGVFSALLGLLGLAVCLRYELAVPLAEDERTMVNLMALAVLAALLVSSLAGLLLLGFSTPLVRLLDAQALAPWLWLLPPALLAVGMLNTFNHWAVRRAAFGRITRTRLAQGIGQATTPVLLGLVTSGPFGLLVGQIIGQTAGFGTHAYHFLRHERHLLGLVTARGILAAAAAYHRFATYGASGALLSGGSRLLPALLLAAIYGVEVAGLFVLTQRVLYAPIQLVGVAVSQVYLSEASRLASKNRLAMAQLFTRTTWRLLAVACAIALVVVVAGPTLFALVFGAAWAAACCHGPAKFTLLAAPAGELSRQRGISPTWIEGARRAGRTAFLLT